MDLKLNINMKQNYEIVLRYLQGKPGERTVKFNNTLYGLYESKLHCIMHLYDDGLDKEWTEEKWLVSDMSLNMFMQECEDLSEQEIMNIIFQSGLNSLLKPRKSEKAININGEIIITNKDSITYEDIVELCYGAKYRTHVFSMTYDDLKNFSGILRRGQSVKIVEGLVFSCYDTSNA